MNPSAHDWALVLEFSIKYDSPAIRVLALERFSTIATPLEKVFYGIKHMIHRWIVNGFVALATREESLTAQEAAYLGYRTTVLVAEVRERVLRRKMTTELRSAEVTFLCETCNGSLSCAMCIEHGGMTLEEAVRAFVEEKGL